MIAVVQRVKIKSVILHHIIMSICQNVTIVSHLAEIDEK